VTTVDEELARYVPCGRYSSDPVTEVDGSKT
jgi:hypothetical protein